MSIKYHTCNGILDLRDISEMSCIRNAQAPHSMCMPPFGKMMLKCFRTFICEIAAYLAAVIQIKTVQLVQPVRNWLAIPTEWQIFRIVWHIIWIFFLLLWFTVITIAVLSLGISSRLLPLNILFGCLALLVNKLGETIQLSFKAGNFIVAECMVCILPGSSMGTINRKFLHCLGLLV